MSKNSRQWLEDRTTKELVALDTLFSALRVEGQPMHLRHLDIRVEMRVRRDRQIAFMARLDASSG